jgi:adenylylsulfate kinase
MLIALAGLPGTGKSTLAARLAEALGGAVLSKDAVRAALFPPPVLNYSAEQDDVCMAAVYAAARAILRSFPRQVVILDGRTFLRSYQVRDLLDLAGSVNEVPRVIECLCEDEVARRRLEDDRARGGHPAGNRTYALYLTLKAAAEPLSIPRLTLDTGKAPVGECVERCLNFLRERGDADRL